MKKEGCMKADSTIKVNHRLDTRDSSLVLLMTNHQVRRTGEGHTRRRHTQSQRIEVRRIRKKREDTQVPQVLPADRNQSQVHLQVLQKNHHLHHRNTIRKSQKQKNKVRRRMILTHHLKEKI